MPAHQEHQVSSSIEKTTAREASRSAHDHLDPRTVSEDDRLAEGGEPIASPQVLPLHRLNMCCACGSLRRWIGSIEGAEWPWHNGHVTCRRHVVVCREGQRDLSRGTRTNRRGP